MLSIEERENLASRDNTWWSYCFTPGGEGEGITTERQISVKHPLQKLTYGRVHLQLVHY